MYLSFAETHVYTLQRNEDLLIYWDIPDKFIEIRFPQTTFWELF